jgi:hypothetical protein
VQGKLSRERANTKFHLLSMKLGSELLVTYASFLEENTKKVEKASYKC